MKLKSVSAVALVLTMLPGMVFGQGLMAKLKAKLAAGKTAGASAMTSKMNGSKMGGMMGMHVGNIIGNKNTKVYHMPGDKNLPEEKNRVYFSSVSAAEAAGYHASGSSAAGSSTSGGKVSKMGKTKGSAMAGGKKHKKK